MLQDDRPHQAPVALDELRPRAGIAGTAAGKQGWIGLEVSHAATVYGTGATLRTARFTALRTRAPAAEDDREVVAVDDAVRIRVGPRVDAAIGAPGREDRRKIRPVDDAIFDDITRARR